jgi:hypothetical protein
MILLCTGITSVAAVNDTDHSVETHNHVAIQSNDTVKDNTIVIDDVISILATTTFNEKTVLSKGLAEIEVIAADIPEFYYWKNADLVEFRWLHSFETGLITHALFEIIGENGQHGYMIYDCEREESSSFSATASPYTLVEESLQTKSLTSDKNYYFYAPMTYGYGILNDESLIDIYDIYGLIADKELKEDNILRSISFQSNGTEKTTSQTRIVVGDADAVLDYEQRRAELDVSTTSRSLEYPNYHSISGVPNYRQSSGCLCIPTSMSNVLSYWDQNGRPDLVPSSQDSNRETYIKNNIVSYLTVAGGTGQNDSIDPAFESYIENNGNYNYTGIEIWNPDYNDLKSEIYGFECPCLIGFPIIYGSGHMTTGVGYTCSSGNKVIVHDNHSTAAVYQSWNDVDFMFSCAIRIPW